MRHLLLVLLLLGGCTTARGDAAGGIDHARAVRFLSFNVRYGTANDGADRWPRRTELVADVITRHAADVVGIQEALDFQIDFLAERFPEFDVVGEHREGGRKGEFAGLLVRRERLEVLAVDHFWLSERPDAIASKGWDAALPRTCTAAHVRDRKTGAEFVVAGTHFDHRGEQARTESAGLIAARLRAGLASELPLVVLGDFNAGEDSAPMARFAAAGLRDSFRDLAADATDVGTFHGFRGGSEGAKIDSVLCSEEWTAYEVAIDRVDTGGRYPSDHNPVFAALALDPPPDRAGGAEE